MTDGLQALVDQIEMNLLFVQAELEAQGSQPESVRRALEHVELALQQLGALQHGSVDNVIPFCRGAA